MTRFAIGYDVHRLVEGRRLIIGGVEIPYEKGLLGHSDADVLLHAVSDALLGAAALGALGADFPAPNIDATVVAQAPKLRPYIDEMRCNIARCIGIDVADVNVKATTEERLGFTGAGEGMSAYAIAGVERI